MELKYYTKEELLPFVDREVYFETFSGTRKGLLTMEKKKLWVPFCGGCNAETLRLNLDSSNFVG